MADRGQRSDREGGKVFVSRPVEIRPETLPHLLQTKSEHYPTSK